MTMIMRMKVVVVVVVVVVTMTTMMMMMMTTTTTKVMKLPDSQLVCIDKFGEDYINELT